MKKRISDEKSDNIKRQACELIRTKLSPAVVGEEPVVVMYALCAVLSGLDRRFREPHLTREDFYTAVERTLRSMDS